MTSNPYESPALAPPSERVHSQLVLELRERKAVDSFLTLNRLVAGGIIAISLMVLASTTAILLTRPLSSLPFIVLLLFPVAVAGLIVGILQLRLSPAAIHVGGIGSGVTLMFLIPLFIAILRSPNVSPRFEAGVVVFVMVLLCVPPLLVLRSAEMWRRRGIDVRDLARVRYRSPNNPFVAK
jgi:hypothetical protein